MSKSIYGIRMPGTMGDVINQLHGLRPLMARRASRLIARAIARTATDHHDRALILGGDIGDNHLSRAYREVQERIADIRRTNTRDPEVDTNFDVVICEDGVNAVLLSFTEHAEWFEDLLSLPGAEDYSYWDGTDRPEDVSAEDWAARRRTYERILSRDPHGRPAGCGVTLSFQPPVGAPSIAAILAEVPGRDTRARRMARQVLLAEWADAQDQGQVDMQGLMAFAASLSHPDMAGEIERRAAEIAEGLPELDQAVLTGAADREVAEDPPALS